ncbi:MAG: SRPBCC domain-containing protein [Archangium gephyra]|uniref:SRPBCC domain-containing protein n=1 Tax=Archangium gephyra TaxID=48 RepID=A0A2W5TEB7_9BACT|nr:MAG: SRPBCC domain-containing protein [Archangium gephyra]
MNPNETTRPGQTDSISFEFDLRHPPEKVWRALTNPVLLSEWLLPVANLKLEAGSEFKLQAPPQPNWDGTVNCKYLEIEREKKLSWSWIVGDIDTVVTFTLAPISTGTRLSLVQSGFKPHQKQNFGGARYGWNMMSEKLLQVLAREP